MRAYHSLFRQGWSNSCIDVYNGESWYSPRRSVVYITRHPEVIVGALSESKNSVSWRGSWQVSDDSSLNCFPTVRNRLVITHTKSSTSNVYTADTAVVMLERVDRPETIYPVGTMGLAEILFLHNTMRSMCSHEYVSQNHLHVYKLRQCLLHDVSKCDDSRALLET